MDARIDQAKPLTRRDARQLILAMLLPVFMGSLDNTILASALPTIGREFGDTEHLSWLITAYLLASTAIGPLYGKIADIHGRRFTLRIAIIVYMTGSLVCALAPNMLVLILARGLHGLGGGGLASMVAVDPRRHRRAERARPLLRIFRRGLHDRGCLGAGPWRISLQLSSTGRRSSGSTSRSASRR